MAALHNYLIGLVLRVFGLLALGIVGTIVAQRRSPRAQKG